jgi:hypothetical protein
MVEMLKHTRSCSRQWKSQTLPVELSLLQAGDNPVDYSALDGFVSLCHDPSARRQKTIADSEKRLRQTTRFSCVLSLAICVCAVMHLHVVVSLTDFLDPFFLLLHMLCEYRLELCLQFSNQPMSVLELKIRANKCRWPKPEEFAPLDWAPLYPASPCS